jgi:hypothetical protein
MSLNLGLVSGGENECVCLSAGLRCCVVSSV